MSLEIAETNVERAVLSKFEIIVDIPFRISPMILLFISSSEFSLLKIKK